MKRVGGRKASLKAKPRRKSHHVSIADDISKALKVIQDRTGKTVSTIVEHALRDAFALWEKSMSQRLSLDDDLGYLKNMVERLDQRVLLLVAKQNLDGAIAYPQGAPLRIPRKPETWAEWQGTLLRIRAEIENSEAARE